MSHSVFFAAHAADLSALQSSARLRRLIPQAGCDFSSNDYLGLASSGLLAGAAREALDRGVPLGSGGSRLLRGNHAEHEALEADAARFFGSESALYFSSGYAANSALISTLPQRGDLIVHDELVHASAHEGMRLSRAECVAARHNDLQSFEEQIVQWRARGGKGRPWIAVESLYSMDGDTAPLDGLAALADAHQAILLVDEAHATGILGAGGRGLAAHLAGRENLITLSTCGKALGAEGALVCGPKVATDFLVNRGRGFIFSTAPSPLMAAIVRHSLKLVAGGDDRRARLWALVRHAETQLSPLGAVASGSQIIPLILGEDARTMAVAARLQENGFDVRGIRPPTVPAGTSRLRISVTLNADAQSVSALAAQVAEALGA